MIQATIIAAQSIDGCITRHDQRGTAFCSKEDQEYFHEALKGFDSMIMGRATFEFSKKSILNSDSDPWLRKILTHSPEKWTDHTRRDALEFTDDPIETLLSELENRDRKRCAILGGETVYEQALQCSGVTEIWLTIEARVFGAGKRLAAHPIDERFKLESSEILGPETILLRFER